MKRHEFELTKTQGEQLAPMFDLVDKQYRTQPPGAILMQVFRDGGKGNYKYHATSAVFLNFADAMEVAEIYDRARMRRDNGDNTQRS